MTQSLAATSTKTSVGSGVRATLASDPRPQTWRPPTSGTTQKSSRLSTASVAILEGDAVIDAQERPGSGDGDVPFMNQVGGPNNGCSFRSQPRAPRRDEAHGSRWNVDTTIAECSTRSQQIPEDMTFTEATCPPTTRSTVHWVSPASWRKIYGGVQPSKSTTVRITDNCGGMLEAYAEVDKACADLSGNMPPAFALSGSGFIEATPTSGSPRPSGAATKVPTRAFTGFAPTSTPPPPPTPRHPPASQARAATTPSTRVAHRLEPPDLPGIYPRAASPVSR